ncbi:MAG: SURF1 family cytochrome oxidase biogenesis protein, partial [Pseudomonadota bacterium]
RAAPTGFPAVVVFPSIADVAAWTGRSLLPWALLLDGDAEDGFAARDWQPTGLPPERHLGYAVQWFALALTLVILWFVFSLKKHERND